MATTKQAKEAIEQKLWSLDSEELGGAILSRLSLSAEKFHVQVVDFRIDKTIDVAGQTEAPFVAVTEGRFEDVMKLVDSIQDPGSKLALGLLQLATSDQGPGRVKATLGLTAFLGEPSK